MCFDTVRKLHQAKGLPAEFPVGIKTFVTAALATYEVRVLLSRMRPQAGANVNRENYLFPMTVNYSNKIPKPVDFTEIPSYVDCRVSRLILRNIPFMDATDST